MRVLLSIFLAMVSCLIQAQPLLLNELSPKALGSSTETFAEEGRPLDLAEVRAKQKNGMFRKGDGDVLTYGIGAPPRWVRLEIVNPTDKPASYFLVAGTTWTDKIDVYLASGRQEAFRWQSGDQYPNPPGRSPGIGFIFPIQFEPGQNELYLRVESVDPMVVPVRLLTETQLQEADIRGKFSYGLIYGFLLALLAYNAMLFIGLEKRSYLYYSIYLTGLILVNLAYTGYGGHFLWPDQPAFQRYAILVLMVLYGCGGLLFASRFLSLADLAPRSLVLIKLFATSSMALILFFILRDSQLGAAWTAFCFVLLFTVVMFFLGIFAVIHAQIAGRYFLASATFGMLGALLTTLSVWGVIPFHWLTYHGLEYGAIIEAAILALALAHHYNEMHMRLARVSVSRDELAAEIAERKAVEEKLLLSLRQLEEKDKVKGRFLAAASHDLRQPLAAATLFVDALRFANPNPKQNEIIQRLDGAMSNFSGLLDSLLDISKLDSRTIKPNLVPIDLDKLFEFLTRNTEPMVREKGLQFRTHLPAKAPLIILTDMHLINAVLMNLVTNAIKFTPGGGILLGARRRGNRALIQVWDTGIGMSSNDIEHIFDEFYQVNNPQRDRTKGIGLGLSIAKRSLALVDGEITCRSRVGHGSLFEFLLPLAGVSFDPTHLEPANTTHVELGKFAQGKLFLVVEDDILVAEALRTTLAAMGGTVKMFHDAESALNCKEIGDADYYIADYMLGGAINGAQFLSRLRQKLDRPFKGVLLTGDTSATFVNEAANFDWLVLYKPISMSKLIEMIMNRPLSLDGSANACQQVG